MWPLRRAIRFCTSLGMKQRIRLLFVLALVSGAFSMAGCKTNEDVDTARPWNGPRSWETGLPAALTEGR